MQQPVTDTSGIDMKSSVLISDPNGIYALIADSMRFDRFLDPTFLNPSRNTAHLDIGKPVFFCRSFTCFATEFVNLSVYQYTDQTFLTLGMLSILFGLQGEAGIR